MSGTRRRGGTPQLGGLRAVAAAVAALLSLSGAGGAGPAQEGGFRPQVQFIFTADPHYGITRKQFRGRRDVDAHTVNAALLVTLNRVDGLTYPQDGGVGAGERVGAMEFVAVGGDLTNRADSGVTPTRDAWARFVADYVDGISLRTAAGARTPVFVVPGNHDIAAAIGWAKAPAGAVDPASMMGIERLMARADDTSATTPFDPHTMRVHGARDVGGLRLQFVQLWPDSAERAWMERDLASVPSTTPVLIFVHDPPDVEAKHFRGRRDAADPRFENLLAETFKDGDAPNVPPLAELRGLAAFVRQHPNIRGYFHGHQNFNEFSVWKGPDGDVELNVFRADSPMKGRLSGEDETRLSFQVVAVDVEHGLMTARELLWNVDAGRTQATAWGASRTVPIR